MRDYYQILDISKSASFNEVKKAFRTAASRTHPDREGGDEAAFKEIYEAYDTLRDGQRRKQYDEHLHSSKQQSPAASSPDRTKQGSMEKKHDYKEQEQQRHQSIIYRLRYSVALVFYLFERLFHAIGLLFDFTLDTIKHLFSLLYALCIISFGSVVAAVILSLVSISKIIPDPKDNTFEMIVVSIAMGGSCAIVYLIGIYQDRYQSFVFRKKIPEKTVNGIFSGLFAGAAITGLSYVLQWRLLGMNLIAIYAVGFLIGASLYLLYIWSRGVNTKFDKH